jgi:hypothetical protein
MERIPGSERTREKLKAVIEGSNEGGGTSDTALRIFPDMSVFQSKAPAR